MQILLLILKIIGIILLAVIGLVILAIGVLLFVPLRYEVDGEIKDEYQLEIKGSIRYLLSSLKLIFDYKNGETDIGFYLFGHRMRQKEDTFDDDTFEECTYNKDEELKEDLETSEVLAQNSLEERVDEEDILEADTYEGLENPKQEKTKQSKRKSKNTKTKKTKSEKSGLDFSRIKKELSDEHNHSVIKKIFAELKYLLRHFKFRKIKTDLIFSAGDPALTGQVLGGIAVFPFLYRYEMHITPDFMAEEFYVKGTFYLKGRVRLIHLLISALKLIFDKEVRMVINKFMSMMK